MILFVSSRSHRKVIIIIECELQTCLFQFVERFHAIITFGHAAEIITITRRFEVFYGSSLDRHPDIARIVRGLEGHHPAPPFIGGPMASILPGRNSGWNHSLFASSSSAVSGSHCFCLPPAGVAVLSTGHHRPACGTAGVLGRRGWVLESVAARMCREAGGRVRVNVFVGTWTFTMSTGWTGAGGKWWWTGYRSGMAHSWPSIPQWSSLSSRVLLQEAWTVPPPP